MTEQEKTSNPAHVSQMEGDNDGPTIQYNGTGDDAIRQIKAIDRVAELEAALRPFVRAFERKRDEYSKRYADRELGYTNFDKMPDDWAVEKIVFSMGAYRRARAALTTEGQP